MTFRYFPNFPKGADLEDGLCTVCGNKFVIPMHMLYPPTSLCSQCLAQRKGKVNIEPWIVRQLENAMRVNHQDWLEQDIQACVAERIDELAHTPPILWLQNNEWPICTDDFAQFIGEITQEKLLAEHQWNVLQAKEALREILVTSMPLWEQDDVTLELEWTLLGNWLAIFAFQCHDSWIYIAQTA